MHVRDKACVGTFVWLEHETRVEQKQGRGLPGMLSRMSQNAQLNCSCCYVFCLLGVEELISVKLDEVQTFNSSENMRALQFYVLFSERKSQAQ